MTNLEQQLEEEREINDVLMKSLSHDLANPLSVINSYIDMMKTGRIPETDHALTLDKIKANTTSALEMIQKIKSTILTRKDSRDLKVNQVRLKYALDQSLSMFEKQALEKEIKIVVPEFPSDLLIVADGRSLVDHVFSTVLSNAIKFSHRGSIVRIDLSVKDEKVIVSFKDQGIGMDSIQLTQKKHHPYPGTEDESGSGLGLIMMAHFLRKFGGSHQIQSEGLGLGVTIHITFRKA